MGSNPGCRGINSWARAGWANFLPAIMLCVVFCPRNDWVGSTVGTQACTAVAMQLAIGRRSCTARFWAANRWTRSHGNEFEAQQCSFCCKRCFLLGPCGVFVRKTTGSTQLISCVEAGTNNSTVALRVKGGDEEEPSAWGITGPSCYWGI
jgi:hypothetical protein